MRLSPLLLVRCNSKCHQTYCNTITYKKDHLINEDMYINVSEFSKVQLSWGVSTTDTVAKIGYLLSNYNWLPTYLPCWQTHIAKCISDFLWRLDFSTLAKYSFFLQCIILFEQSMKLVPWKLSWMGELDFPGHPLLRSVQLGWGARKGRCVRRWGEGC